MHGTNVSKIRFMALYMALPDPRNQKECEKEVLCNYRRTGMHKIIRFQFQLGL